MCYQICSITSVLVPFFIYAILHKESFYENEKNFYNHLTSIRYVENVLSLNNLTFCDYVELFFPFKIKENIDIAKIAHNKIENGNGERVKETTTRP